jgi:hypothetical protein
MHEFTVISSVCAFVSTAAAVAELAKGPTTETVPRSAYLNLIHDRPWSSTESRSIGTKP